MKSTSPEADPACTDANVLRRARIALAAVCEPGEAGLADAIDSRGPTATVAALLDGGRQRPKIPRADGLRRRLEELDLDALIDRGRDIGARVVVPGDSQWPGRMNELRAHRPLALWCWGEADPRLMALRFSGNRGGARMYALRRVDCAGMVRSTGAGPCHGDLRWGLRD